MTWKRTVMKRVPVLARLVKQIETLETHAHQVGASNLQLQIRLEDAHRQLAHVASWMFVDDARPETAAAVPDDDGVPVPPPPLRFLVGGTDNLDSFFGAGRQCVQALRQVLGRQGLSLNQFGRVLDFGCGCGRVLRHLKDVVGEASGTELHGTDCNSVAIHWCRRNLRFATFGTNSLRPPLDYPDGHFNFAFAFSIFTHLTEELQAAWLKEWRRILAPGGYLLVTVHGDRRLAILTEAEQAEYTKGNLVVREPGVAGSNICAAFHPASYFRRIVTPDFEVIDHLPEGPDLQPPQDVYLLRAA